jgi:uncharacterized spore protein YtfJ
MAAQNKPTAPTKITSVVHTLLEGLHSMSKSETLIGEPYTLGDATIVPIHRLRVALGAGSVHGGAKQNATSGESGALGAGGVVQIEPVAVITVGRDGVPRIMCVESEPNATERLLEQLPDVLSRAAKLLSERVAPLARKLVSSDAANTIASAASALPEAATALLSPKEDKTSG